MDTLHHTARPRMQCRPPTRAVSAHSAPGVRLECAHRTRLAIQRQPPSLGLGPRPARAALRKRRERVRVRHGLLMQRAHHARARQVAVHLSSQRTSRAVTCAVTANRAPAMCAPSLHSRHRPEWAWVARILGSIRAGRTRRTGDAATTTNHVCVTSGARLHHLTSSAVFFQQLACAFSRPTF